MYNIFLKDGVSRRRVLYCHDMIGGYTDDDSPKQAYKNRQNYKIFYFQTKKYIFRKNSMPYI